MFIRFSFLLLFVVLLLPAQSFAGQPRFLQAYDDWDAYMYVENDSKVCYMASRPTDKEGKYKSRGDAYVYITHRPAEKSFDVFGYVAGYTYKTGSEVKVVIDGQETVLFTQEDKAWAVDEASDKALMALIKKGSKLVVHGESSRGTKTVDTYSLKGSGKAYERISKECGL